MPKAQTGDVTIAYPEDDQGVTGILTTLGKDPDVARAVLALIVANTDAAGCEVIVPRLRKVTGDVLAFRATQERARGLLGGIG